MFVLEVSGMTCGGCANSVTNAVRRLDPNAQVSVDLATGRVQIDGQLTPQQAKSAVDDAGFEARTTESG